MIGAVTIVVVGGLLSFLCLGLAFAAVLAWRIYPPDSSASLGALAAFVVALGGSFWLAENTLRAVGAL